MNHRIGRVVFGLAVGFVVAIFAFQWISNPQPRAARAEEERVVEVARTWLTGVVGVDTLEVVDPLAPNRKIGKTYVYAEPPGWAVSGFYRRDAGDRWHPYLITLDESLEFVRLKVQDSQLEGRARSEPRLEIVP